MKRLVLIAIIYCVAVAGGAATSARAPDAPRDAPATAAPGSFVWHDLVTDDAARCRVFYAGLFGWTFEPAPGVDPDYTIIKHGDRWIGGIVAHRPADQSAGGAQWLAYVAVADVDRVADSFRRAGGRVLRGPLNARKDLRVAAVADAEGAPLGLASRGPNVATPDEAPLNDWLWMEYVARDPDAALSFYGDVLGYRHEISETRENFTYYVLSTDRPRAGLFRTLWQRERSAWLPYVRVENPAAIASRVTELGGSVLIPPQPRVRNSSLTIVLDPAGAPLALQKYPFDKGATP